MLEELTDDRGREFRERVRDAARRDPLFSEFLRYLRANRDKLDVENRQRGHENSETYVEALTDILEFAGADAASPAFVPFETIGG